jgi:plasmid stabilization system protein ParE
MSDYILSTEAKKDLSEIYEYIAKDNLLHADKVFEKFLDMFQLLSEFPDIGHFRGDLTSADLKFIQIYSYLIIYDYKSKPIVINRILNAHRNIGKIIN